MATNVGGSGRKNGTEIGVRWSLSEAKKNRNVLISLRCRRGDPRCRHSDPRCRYSRPEEPKEGGGLPGRVGEAVLGVDIAVLGVDIAVLAGIAIHVE